MDTANDTTPAEKVRVLTLPAQPQAVREARHRVHSLLRNWASPVDWDTAVLLLSEVVTNAIVPVGIPRSRPAAHRPSGSWRTTPPGGGF